MRTGSQCKAVRRALCGVASNINTAPKRYICFGAVDFCSYVLVEPPCPASRIITGFSLRESVSDTGTVPPADHSPVLAAAYIINAAHPVSTAPLNIFCLIFIISMLLSSGKTDH